MYRRAPDRRCPHGAEQRVFPHDSLWSCCWARCKRAPSCMLHPHVRPFRGSDRCRHVHPSRCCDGPRSVSSGRAAWPIREEPRVRPLVDPEHAAGRARAEPSGGQEELRSSPSGRTPRSASTSSNAYEAHGPLAEPRRPIGSPGSNWRPTRPAAAPAGAQAATQDAGRAAAAAGCDSPPRSWPPPPRPRRRRDHCHACPGVRQLGAGLVAWCCCRDMCSPPANARADRQPPNPTPARPLQISHINGCPRQLTPRQPGGSGRAAQAVVRQRLPALPAGGGRLQGRQAAAAPLCRRRVRAPRRAARACTRPAGRPRAGHEPRRQRPHPPSSAGVCQVEGCREPLESSYAQASSWVLQLGAARRRAPGLRCARCPGTAPAPRGRPAQGPRCCVPPA